MLLLTIDRKSATPVYRRVIDGVVRLIDAKGIRVCVF
jgi:hypothetical protein